MSTEGFLSIIPPVLAIVLAITTKRVLLSLAAGIFAGAFIFKDFSVVEAVKHSVSTFTGNFYSGGSIEIDSFYMFSFLLTLGALTCLTTVSGGTRAFAAWASQKINSREKSQFLAMITGIAIFIDDYFNALTVGSVCKPLTDRYKVSREKLAFIIDSTSAPICVLVPLSSWGAYIISLLAGTFESRGIEGISPFMAFLELIPMNLYAMFSIILVYVTIKFGIEFGPMRVAEERARNTGELFDESKGIPSGSIVEEPAVEGSLRNLIIPILTLIATTIFFILYTGHVGSGKEQFDLLAAIENTQSVKSMAFGGYISIIVASLLCLQSGMSPAQLFRGIGLGLKSMVTACVILAFAWTIGSIIGDVETGKHLAALVSGSIPVAFLPAIIFFLAGVMAFSTGTSWGSFGILIPIAADISMAIDPALLLPSIGAVLAGAVFGDHCSPISDTTILSSTGAGSHHMDHVVTQIPYALTTAGISLVGYLVMGITESAILGILASAVAFTLALLYLKRTAVTGLIKAPKEA